MQSVHLTMAATKDLADIDQYSVREWGEAQADRYLNQLEACFLRLAKNPLLGRECSTIRPGLRRIEQGRHAIFYRRTEYGISVSRILHQGMEPELHRMS